jgi:nitronate monooxygenase
MTMISALGFGSPIVAAPMAGGPSTPAFVAAAGRAGALAFVAAGYQTADQLAGQIKAVRESAGGAPGVNVFAPNPVPLAEAEFRAYADSLRDEMARYGLDPAASGLVEDDDAWSEKIDLLVADPVPVVGFTFAIPDRAVIAALRKAGSLVVQTVTSAEEATAAADAGADLLAVQASAAGGHSGTLTPHRIAPEVPLPELIAQVKSVVSLPLLAAGGLATSRAVAEALAAGAEAAMVGTALLRTEESGASPTYKDALGAFHDRETVVTRAFTGRPARALRNDFTDRYSAASPGGYPALHHLTRPLRQAAAAAGDPERLHLWAGTGFRQARVETVQSALRRLETDL